MQPQLHAAELRFLHPAGMGHHRRIFQGRPFEKVIKHLPAGRNADLLVAAVEKLKAKSAFQRRDLFAHHRLAHIVFVGRFGNAPDFHQRQKQRDLLICHADPPCISTDFA